MGGAEYQAGLLADELDRHPGVVVTYLARHVPSERLPGGPRYAVRSIGTDAGIRRRAVFFDAPALWGALRQLQPDVIYQQAKQSYTAVCAAYARRYGIPFFCHVASDADLDHRWISLRLTVNTPFDIIESLAGDWGIRHASHIVVQTEQQGARVRARFGREPAALVRNFQPIPAALPAKPPGPLQVLWVANFKDVKRPELFVDLAESFAGRQDLQFIMVGRPTTLRRFAPLMRRIPTVANLSYLGEQPIGRVYELMASAAIHVNTSSFEGFPNTFVQAWARGAVVVSIAVDPDGCMEAHNMGYCAGSFNALRDRIEALAQAPELRRELAERAFAFAQQHHPLAAGERFAELILAAAASAKHERAGAADKAMRPAG
jgi:glycosyltransferase involved in cell wall biosynthesis